MATEAKTQAEVVEETKVVFDERQQARVDELIREAQGRAAKELRQQNEQLKRDMETRLAEMQAKLESKPRSQHTKSDTDDVEALRAQMEEMKTVSTNAREELERHRKLLADKDNEVKKVLDEALNVRKNSAIQNAAQKVNFLDLDDVIRLTADFVRFDESRGRFVVVNDQGVERMNASYEPMTLEEFYTEYSKKKPHLVKGDFKGGAGSKPNESAAVPGTAYRLEDLFGSKSDPAKANELAMRDINEYRRLRVLAQKQRLIA
jgi:hypothetical protein